MRYLFLAGFVAAAASSSLAQRITGDEACLTACYDVSVAVTQCPDLSDTGVISCICPNATQAATLTSCHTCINTLQGMTAFEVQSIQTLYAACTNGTASSIASSGTRTNPTSAATGTIASGASGATSAGAPASTSQGSGGAINVQVSFVALGATLLGAAAMALV